MFFGTRWTKFAIMWLITTNFVNSASLINGLICYICNPQPLSDNTESFETHITFPSIDIQTIPICGTNEAKNFTLICPRRYQGCLTKIYGNTVLKTCHEQAIVDCKIANNVKYCFCDSNKCNNETVLSIPIISDDEDLDQTTDDGSGLYDYWTELNNKQTIVQNITTKKSLNSIFIQNEPMFDNSNAALVNAKTFLVIICIILNNVILNL
ncbi:uncharacterized protein LOC126900605 [Daktulosphaira vitifoliae]|uniref:uncharacterized protein LOC126900605 n=1 Tax=Daktulosphaira vitifoliae TaxID=58002 RepID=UPI0021A9AC0D|nr:uncharacterized protein LOC126900605 [Daktulosphaira vitifoliae]